MSSIPAVRFSFRERMSGPMARGVSSPRVGVERGRAEGTYLVGDFVVTIDDLAACVAAPDHPARLAGAVTYPELAERAPIRDGSLHLYVPDPQTGMKQMRYRLAFEGGDGETYRLEATKFIRPGRASIREQVTAWARLFGPAGGDQPVAAGAIVFHLRDLVAFLGSMRAEGLSRAAGLRHFLAFSQRELRTPVPALAT